MCYFLDAGGKKQETSLKQESLHVLNLTLPCCTVLVWRGLLEEDTQKIITVGQHQQEAYSSHKLAPLQATRSDWITLNLTNTRLSNHISSCIIKTFSTICFSQKRKKNHQYLLSLRVKPDFDPNGKLGAFTNSTSSFLLFPCRCCFTTCF